METEYSTSTLRDIKNILGTPFLSPSTDEEQQVIEIDIFFKNSSGRLILIERWTIIKELAKPSRKNVSCTLKSCTLMRSLYSYLRLLPAHRYSKDNGKELICKLHSLVLKQRENPFEVGMYRIGSTDLTYKVHGRDIHSQL